MAPFVDMVAPDDNTFLAATLVEGDAHSLIVHGIENDLILQFYAYMGP